MGSGREDAVAYIESVIKDLRLRREDRLPSIRAMASSAGVSLVTMVRAVREVESQGLVVSRRGSGVRLAGVAPAGTAEALPRTKWERVQLRIQNDLAAGLFVPGSALPSVKELSLRYGACRETVTKALRALAESERLRARPGGFEAPLLRTRAAGNRVVLLLPVKADGSGAELFPRTQEALRTLEAECTRSAAKLDIHLYSRARDQVYSRGGTAVCSGEDLDTLDALGIMAWCMGMSGSTGIAGLSAGLRRCRRPVAVWDDYDEMTVTLPKGRSRMRVFASEGGFAAGKAVGEVVRDRGHTNIAYVSAFHSSPWSMARLEGLRSVFSARDGADHVVPATSSGLEWPGAFQFKEGYQDVAEHREQLADDLSRLGERDSFCNGVTAHLQRYLEESVDQQVHWELVAPLFEAAIKTGATAWVAAADSTAAMALRFLRGRGIDVPGELSLVGFDDSLEASLRGITSYNFNEQALVRAMLGHILGAPEAYPGAANDVAEVPGFVVQRHSLKAP